MLGDGLRKIVVLTLVLLPLELFVTGNGLTFNEVLLTLAVAVPLMAADIWCGANGNDHD